KGLIGDLALLSSLTPSDFIDAHFGLPTVVDILKELEKPGRDPRPEFRTARFKDGVETMKDLKPGMLLEGVVTNVANFGAFVDVGVHQDGLVHVSALSRKFVKDPREVVKPGDVVKVKVVDVDSKRKRISLTMLLDEPAVAPPAPSAPHGAGHGAGGKTPRKPEPPKPVVTTRKKEPPAPGERKSTLANSAMAEAFARASLKSGPSKRK
ncbi:MAG: S1 RNA-binding domain-containing protein, partial [Alphaproteobacteria bacterium]|nr:S1 RNA-binding domain-containing protein [Alphaproteobacteria bacterium]